MRAVRDGLFTTDPPALLGSRCASCRRYAFPRATGCAYCGHGATEPVTLSTSGTLWGWTEVTASPPAYLGEVPFGFGVVELPEGLRIITRLASPVDGYEHGQAMTLRLVELRAVDDQRVVTWEFRPA